MKIETDLHDKILGCLVGGALGDSLGNPIEFIFNNHHIQSNPVSFDKTSNSSKFRITDDTQMTLFTAEGLLEYFKTNNFVSVLHSYHRWLKTQGYTPIQKMGSIYSNISEENMMIILNKGFLVNDKRLNKQEAPGSTTLNALMYGRLEPDNDSKGCGGIMRAAPAGILATSYENAYFLGRKVSHFTHNHPTGYIAAGAFSMFIYGLMNDEDLYEIKEKVLSIIDGDGLGNRETIKAINKAFEFAEKDELMDVSKIGEGWIAEETLSIALYCLLKYPDDFNKAVELSVNHGGDSDSTGAVCGNLMGIKLGLKKVKENIDIEKVAILDLIERMGCELYDERVKSYTEKL